MTADAVGGVWTYALDLARALRAHGVETTLLVNGPPPAEPPADVASVATGLPLDWVAQRPEEVLDAGARLAEIAGDLRAEVVQLNSPAYGAAARFPAPVVGVQHSCTATWWRAVRREQRWPQDILWRFDLARRGLLACEAVVAPTHAFASEVHAAYDLPAPIHVVWNGRSARPHAFRGHEREVLTAGRLWDEGKGMAVLDAAAAKMSVPVRAAGPLAAPGGEPAAFRHLETLGVLSPDALGHRLSRCAAFVAPSLYEPFGLAVLEAAQVGRPLVLADIPVFQELWRGAASFFPPGDADALARKLEALLGSGQGQFESSMAARERARRYTVEAMAAGMMDVYARVQLRRS